MNADYEGAIRRAIDRLPAADVPAGRARLYARARILVRETALLGEEERQAAVDGLEAAIARIEADAAPADPAVAAPAESTSKPLFPRRGLAAALAAAICLVAAFYWAFAPRGTPGDTLVSDFEEGDEAFTSASGRSLESSRRADFAFDRVDGRSVLRITGRAQILSAAAYPVDTGKLYRMEVALRTVEDAGGDGSAVAAGVATYDAEGRLQTDPPGPHRYFALGGTLSPADGWQIRAGYITAEGNETHLSFRPGTRYVRPAIVVREPGAVVEIDYVRFEECSARDQCRAAVPAAGDAVASPLR